MCSKALVGCWKLQDWYVITPAGNKQPYTQEDLGGFLHYGADGQMAVAIYEENTAHLHTSYSGPYEWDGSAARHSPVAGFPPPDPDVTKVRFLAIDGSSMVMETPWISESEGSVKYQLKWQKVNDGNSTERNLR